MDVYDDSLNKVGVATRNEAHRKGYWHLNLHCWVVTKRKGGAVVFQVRSEDKSTFSGLLDSTVGGHYKAGEQLEDVAREIKEEIGLAPDVKKLVPLGSRVDVSGYDGLSKREIAEVFFIRDDRPLRAFKVDPLEVRALVEVRIWDGLRLFSGRSKKNQGGGGRVGQGREGNGGEDGGREEELRPEDGLVLYDALHHGDEAAQGGSISVNLTKSVTCDGSIGVLEAENSIPNNGTEKS